MARNETERKVERVVLDLAGKVEQLHAKRGELAKANDKLTEASAKWEASRTEAGRIQGEVSQLEAALQADITRYVNEVGEAARSENVALPGGPQPGPQPVPVPEKGPELVLEDEVKPEKAAAPVAHAEEEKPE